MKKPKMIAGNGQCKYSGLTQALRLRQTTSLLIVAALVAGCGENRSADFSTNRLSPVLTARVDYESGLASISGQVYLDGQQNRNTEGGFIIGDLIPVRLVDGDHLVATWGDQRKTLYRRDAELTYRTDLSIVDSPSLRVGMYRGSPSRSDAPDNIVTLADVESLVLDQSLQLIPRYGELTLSWTLSTDLELESLALEFSIQKCQDVDGNDISNASDLADVKQINLGLDETAVSVAASNLPKLPHIPGITISDCEHAVQMISQQGAESTDTHLESVQFTTHITSRKRFVTINELTGDGS
ncbi:MAG: hypothetical protein V3U76_06650 [Granulosicoccus sp.]